MFRMICDVCADRYGLMDKYRQSNTGNFGDYPCQLCGICTPQKEVDVPFHIIAEVRKKQGHPIAIKNRYQILKEQHT